MSADSRELPAATAAWRQSRWIALAEFALVAAIFWADFRHWIPVSKTPELLLLGWISLRLRGLRWKNVGLSWRRSERKRSWKKTLALGAIAGVLIEAFELFVSQPLLIHFTGKHPDLSDFIELHGNFKLLLLGLALTWTLAAFGEEMFWRGYLMNRVADVVGGPQADPTKRTRFAWITSLIAVNIPFGFAHAYQGITGILDEGLMGLMLGGIYLFADCDLLVPIVAHGVQDSIDIVLMFLGKYPGM